MPPASSKAASAPIAVNSRSCAPAARSPSPAAASVSASMSSAIGSRRCGLAPRIASTARRAPIGRPWRHSVSARSRRSARFPRPRSRRLASSRRGARRTVPSARPSSPASICARASPSSSAMKSMIWSSSPRSPASGRRGLGVGRSGSAPRRRDGLVLRSRAQGALEPARRGRDRGPRGAPRTEPGSAVRRGAGRRRDRLEALDHLVDGEDPGQECLARPDPAGHGAGVLHAQLGRPRCRRGRDSASDRVTRDRYRSVRAPQDRTSPPARRPGVESRMDAELPTSAYIALKVETSYTGSDVPEAEKEAAAHAVAEDRAEEVERPAIRVIASDARHPEAEVALAQAPAGDPQRAGRAGHGTGAALAARGQAGRSSGGPPAPTRRRDAHLVVIDRTGDGQHIARRPIGGPPVSDDPRCVARRTEPMVPAISRPSG